MVMKGDMSRGGKKAKAATGRELWLQALKDGRGTMATGRKPGNPGHKTEVEFWSGNLRKSGEVNEAKPLDSFTGLRNTNKQDIPYLSTPHYLRQSAGLEKPTPRSDPMSKTAVGTPNYKSPEEYYDEVIELKKQILNSKGEMDSLKQKVRRLEEENAKKEKQLEQLLDPSKNEELRRTLGDRKADAAIVIQSLKQKVFKLEQQVKEKEAAHAKLATDLKATKMEEMKVQLEVLYTEVLRLRNAPAAEVEYARHTAEMAQGPAPSHKESNDKIEALSKTIRKINEDKTKLATENKTLKEDLQRLMEQKDQAENIKRGLSRRISFENMVRQSQGEFEDMNRNQLLKALSQMEQKLKRMEEEAAVESRPPVAFKSTGGDGAVDTENKVALQGSVRDRLDQLDKRESELLGAIQQRDKTLARLKEDRLHYRKKCEDQSKSIIKLEEEVAAIKKRPGSYERDSESSLGPRTPAPRHRRETSFDRSEKRSAGPTRKEVETFREKHAATVIQRGFRKHRGEEEATEMIQSALRGYKNRENFIKNRQDSSSTSSSRRSPPRQRRDSTDSESIEFLQSAVRGYNARQQLLRQNRQNSDDDLASSSTFSSRSPQPFARKFEAEEPSQGSTRRSGANSTTGSVRSSTRRSVGREGTHIGQSRSSYRAANNDAEDGF